MQGTDGTPLNIIKKVAADDYTTFGMCLLQDVNGDQIDIIENNLRHEGAEAITHVIIQKWAKGGGPTCTYQHLIECLRLSGLGALAEEINNCVQQ